MDIRKLNARKSVKLVFLLTTALLIATASATVYNYMFQSATVGVEGMVLEWIGGSDSTSAGTTINGVTCSLAELKGPANGTRIYGDPVRLRNTDDSSVSFDLIINDVSGNTENLDSIVVRLIRVSDDQNMGDLTVWSNGAKGDNLPNLSIGGNAQWKFQWEITWKSTATTSDTVSVELQIKVPV